MFFHIASDPSHGAHCGLTPYAVLNGTTILLDKGWTHTEQGNVVDFRKGYSTECSISDIDPSDPTVGNYCVIQYHKPSKTWSLHYDTLRGFPIYYDQSIITNIKCGAKNVRLTTSVIMEDTFAHATPYNPIKFRKHGELPLDEVTDLVEQSLLDYITNFLKFNQVELSISPTYGYDCGALQSILDFNNIPYTLTDPMLNNKPVRDDVLFKEVSKHYWGYKQLAITPHMQTLLTGFCGDEFLMRGPQYVFYYLNQFGIDFREEVLKRPEAYQYQFVNERYIERQKFDNRKSLNAENLSSALLEDYQMWGLDENMTVLPYKNIDILELGFRLSPEDALEQALNAKIQHNIIEKCNDTLLNGISSNKNER